MYTQGYMYLRLGTPALTHARHAMVIVTTAEQCSAEKAQRHE